MKDIFIIFIGSAIALIIYRLFGTEFTLGYLGGLTLIAIVNSK